MMTLDQNETREQWLNNCAEYLMTEILIPALNKEQLSYTEPKFRVSLGSLSKPTKTIGVCWSRSASTDDTNEIFISPFIDDSRLILATLQHELIHAIDDNKSKHKGFFRKLALASGLQGKMTATTASDALNEFYQEMIELFGEIPHARLDVNKKPNVQKGRQVKVYCPDCDFKFNTSRTQIERIVNRKCPVCLVGDLKDNI